MSARFAALRLSVSKGSLRVRGAGKPKIPLPRCAEAERNASGCTWRERKVARVCALNSAQHWGARKGPLRAPLPPLPQRTTAKEPASRPSGGGTRARERRRDQRRWSVFGTCRQISAGASIVDGPARCRVCSTCLAAACPAPAGHGERVWRRRGVEEAPATGRRAQRRSRHRRPGAPVLTACAPQHAAACAPLV